MTRKEIFQVLDDAVGDAPRVDLAEAAWAQGVGMRRRRRVALAGGGTMLAAAAVVGAVVVSGGLAPGEDMAPAVPTSTPGPTQVEPEPADLADAQTFLFFRDGTNTDLEPGSLQPLAGQAVPTVADLKGSAWALVPMESVTEAQELLDIDLAAPEDAGADVPTTLSFVEAEDGDTLLSMSIDGCGGATFQEDLTLAADGRFVGQPAATEDQGCPEDVQAAEDLWIDVLPAGGWLHQPSQDVLLLSVIVPADAAPDPETTADPTGEQAAPADLADAHTLVFRVPGSDVGFDVATVPPLVEQQIPTVEDLTGSSWELVPVDMPWDLKGPNEVSGINIVAASDYEPRVPTTLAFPEEAGLGAQLSVSLADCVTVVGRADGGLTLSEDGRFAAPAVDSTVRDCGQEVPETFWVAMLSQGGWLHQPSADVLLLSVVAPDGLLPEDAPPPETPDPTSGVEALDIGVGLPDGWTKVALGVSQDAGATTTCLLPDGESALFHFGRCTVGVEVTTGIDALAGDEGLGWWDPAAPPEGFSPDECYVARQDYGAPDNAVTFAPDPETGSTTIAGHPVEWFRWAATCAEGQEFVAEAWRVTDLGIQLRSMDGSQEVEPLVRALLEDGQAITMGQVDVEVTEPISDLLTGELQAWDGVHVGTGEQVSFTITDDTRCLVTKPGGVLGADLELGSCVDLMIDLENYPIARVIVTPDGDVLTVQVPAMF